MPHKAKLNRHGLDPHVALNRCMSQERKKELVAQKDDYNYL